MTRFKNNKKEFQKKATQRRRMLCMEKRKRCMSCSTRAHKCPQMPYLVLEKIASKDPQATAEPSALFISFRLQSALRARIRILKNRVFREGMKVVYKRCRDRVGSFLIITVMQRGKHKRRWLLRRS